MWAEEEGGFIPRVCEDLTTTRILVTELATGEDFDQRVTVTVRLPRQKPPASTHAAAASAGTVTAAPNHTV